MKNNECTETPSPHIACDGKNTDGENAERVRFFDSVMEAVSCAVPQGATVLAIGFDNVDVFLRAGYRVTDKDPDVIIARGGEREFECARTANCRTPDAKLILCPTHAYPAAASSVFRATDDVFALRECGHKPFAAVFDTHDIDRNLASVFGEFAALDLCAFDYLFGARMRGEMADDGTVKRVASLLTDLTAELKPICKDKAKAAASLVDAGKRAARIVEDCPELLHASGAAQVCEAVRMLYSAEDRPLGMRGETEMILSVAVTDFYIKNLDGSELEFPPDNNRRIDSICEYFKTDVRRACVYTSAIYPPFKMRLCEYRRDEFRTELAQRLSEIKRRQNNAWQIFKRLYDDDGYCVKSLVDSADLGLCLALAPDVFASDSMLSFLKQTGSLEKYIV